jgi:hypothetical protein
MLNNPLRYIDPSGNTPVCGQANSDPECNGSIDRPSLPTLDELAIRYGIKFDGDGWNWQKKAVVLAAAYWVGKAFSRTIGGTAETAFQNVFNTIVKPFVFMWGSSGQHRGSLTSECAGISSGACTSSSNLINIVSQWSNSRYAGYTVVHEFGHAFNNRFWYRTTSGVARRLPEAFVDADANLARSKGGFAGDYGSWQQSTIDSDSEVFADMFLGWTYGQWWNNASGIYRKDFMSRLMPQLLRYLRY